MDYGFMYTKNFNIPFSLAVSIALITITTALLIFYARETFDPKWAPIIGGMAISSLVALIQFSINYRNYRSSEKLEDCGVIDFLNTRGDRLYYSDLINKTNKEFNLLFHTSKRFFEDFCETQPSDNILTQKMTKNNNIKVRMLLAHPDFLSPEDKTAYEISKRAIDRLTQDFGERFQVRFYRHKPNHNLFITDKDAVIGPYFDNEKGKYLPSIHFRSNASFVEPYKRFFNNEWKNAESND